MTYAAELRNVTKIYRKRHLGRLTTSVGVSDISFAVEKGEIFGLLGLNGAGKTTTIKLLTGLLFPTQGEVRLSERILPDLEALRQIGYLPELPAFYKYLTASEFLFLFGRLSDLSDDEISKRIPATLKRVKLSAQPKKRLGEYSKGMLQRVGLAQALLHDPAFLILDEPISGLDPLGLNEMRQLILDLNKQGKTIFFSSHILSEAEKICHRVGIIHAGKLARIIPKSDWQGAEGKLENLFLETVHA